MKKFLLLALFAVFAIPVIAASLAISYADEFFQD